MTRPRLILFDMDGTLVDSQGHIVAAMEAAFRAVGQPPPSRATCLSVVGLSLAQALLRLAPGHDTAAMEARYRETYFDLRRDGTPALYPGIRACLDRFAEMPATTLGIVTGGSRRGVAAMIEAHGLGEHFALTHTADTFAAKPDPAMVTAAICATDHDPARTAVIGDTTYDIGMARAAGAVALGVSWGYHAAEALSAAGARAVADSADALPGLVTTEMDDE